MARISALCPACGQTMYARRYQCPKCDTAVEGVFQACGFCQLSIEQLDFIRTFLRARGNIKEVERELGISYPTVRARLDTVIAELGLMPPERDTAGVLERIESGELTVQDALAALRRK